MSRPSLLAPGIPPHGHDGSFVDRERRTPTPDERRGVEWLATAAARVLAED